MMNMHEDAKDRVICEAILMMAKKMGLKVIVEGVEKQEHLALLKNIHCEFGQGYHIAKPLSVKYFEAYYSMLPKQG